ncbi:WHG domain-containing protein [Streptomyces sp. NPDC005805]|uniref:TetR/AcrR family transcriptional regulator n=1 Tax=Streptomyces sp. NPDC005805 TaxID=3157068 RepID=UPI0033FA6FEE
MRGPVVADTADTTYHHGNLRAALLERAAAVLAESGPDGLSLRALARDLGVSHAAPSRHFRDRRALLDALAADGFTELNRRLSEAAGAPGDTESRLTGAARAYVRFAVERPALLGLMFAAKTEQDPTSCLRELGHESLRLAAALVEQGQREGLVRPGDPHRLAQVAFSTVHGLATLALGSLLDDTPLDEALDLAVDVLLHGLRAPAASV